MSLPDSTLCPEISVVIEGYNETLEIGCLDETLAALRAQDFPLEKVEVLLVGSEAQANLWRSLSGNPAPFGAVRCVSSGEAHYYQLKNLGADQARGDILALLDSDVIPEPQWLRTVADAIACGAEATCGPSLFRNGDPKTVYQLPYLIAASISWSFVVDPAQQARGFLSHNLAMRKQVFERLRYATQYGRTCAGSVLHEDMRKAGVKLQFLPQQRIAHAFQWKWWSTRLHVRFGHEMYLLHRMEPTAVSKNARWLGPLDALATPLWHVLLDFPKWWNYSKILGIPAHKRVAGLFLTLPLSLIARGAEMVGMIATLLTPRRMREFAAQN